MNKENTYSSVLMLVLLLILSHEIRAQKTNPNGFNKFYFDNGIVSSEGTLKEGKPEGYWKNYFPTGQLKSEGSRKKSFIRWGLEVLHRRGNPSRGN